MGYSLDSTARQLCYSTTNVLHSNIAATSTTNAAYTKLKEIMLTYPIAAHGSIRAAFDMDCVAFAEARGKIYRNGVAVGVEHGPMGGGFVTYTDDLVFTDLKQGDKIQLYAKNDGGHTTDIRNFIIYAVLSPMLSTLE